MEIIEEVERNRLMSPLQIVDMMESSDNVKLDICANWISSVFRREDQRIQEDYAIIEQYNEDTAKLREVVTELKKDDVVYQTSVCSACNHSLEHPSVHFVCQHSYLSLIHI